MNFLIINLLYLFILICVAIVFFVLSKIFAAIYGLAMLPFLAVGNLIDRVESEKIRVPLLVGFSSISKILSYYFICIWPALVVYLFSTPNIPNFLTLPWLGAWCWFGVAITAFLVAGLIDLVTLSAFILFCYNPVLIERVYNWVPFF
ncbi:putative membrane protein [Waddlia chondrophila WSU 86-1044]|uniref:Putative membrane protein n=1 Tax=Waddlia chondrophila (strain ATCC VR-1470 / WSU 86-1044) TaxID=716544 RepID=D6YV77_WADCW|nr:putative membrane protein [Waddlia chondrophila WSU 86-1044]